MTSKALDNVIKLNQELRSVKDFGAVGDGVADDTAAIQAAVDAAINSSISRGVLFPAGTYKVTSPINILSLSAIKKDGPKIVGSGINETVIDYRGSGTVFNIRGIPLSDGSGTQTGTYFIWNALFQGFTLSGENKSGTTDGVELVGLWNSTFENVKFISLRHGIVSNGDATYNANPDWSSTANCLIDACYFERLTGWGFFNNVVQAAPGWSILRSIFVLCGSGGILLSSGQCLIADCSWGGAGWSSETATPTPNASAIRVTGGSVTVTSQIVIERNEFDTSFTSDIDLEYAGGVRIANNRHIFNDRYGYGSICPTNGAIRFAPASAANAVQNVTFVNQFFRLDAGPTTGTAIAFNFVNATNVQNVDVISTAFSDNNSTLNIVPVSGATSGNRWIRNNFEMYTDTMTGSGSTPSSVLPGRPFAEYIGAISGTPAGAIVDTVRPFDVRETVNDQIFGTDLYNTTTGIFTCPTPGYYDVDLQMAIDGALTSDYHTFAILKNGSFYVEVSGAGQGGTRTYYNLRRRIFCDAGDTLAIQERLSPSRNIRGAYSYLRIALER